MLKKYKRLRRRRRSSRQLNKKRDNAAMMLDAVDALGGAMLEVIKEEEGDESFIDLEHIKDDNARRSPTLKLRYDAQFPWFSHRIKQEKQPGDAVLLENPILKEESPNANNSKPKISFNMEDASSVQEEIAIGELSV